MIIIAGRSGQIFSVYSIAIATTCLCRNPRIVMMPTLSSLVVLWVTITKTSSGLIDNKVGIMITVIFQCSFLWLALYCCLQLATQHYVVLWENTNLSIAKNLAGFPTYRARVCFVIWFLAATKQLYEWFSPSVRPSVRPSVCPSVTPFWLCSHHRIIMKFSGVITSDRTDVHAKGQGQRSRSQRSQPNLTVSGL